MGEKQIAVKAQVVEELKEKMQKSHSMVLYNYIGLTVEQVTNLRAKFRAADVEYKVIKNSIIKRAVDGLGIEGLDEHLEGPTALALGMSDPVSPAKILSQFVKDVKKTEIKAGYFDGKALDQAGVQMLADLPSREELLSRMVGSMQSAVGNFVRCVDAIAKKKESEA